MGYKMKHKKGEFPFKSPLKISDAELVQAQSKLDSAQLDFKEPGWAVAATTAVGKTKARKKREKAEAAKKAGGGGETKPTASNGKKSVSEIAGKQAELEAPKQEQFKDYSQDPPKLQRGTTEGLSYVPPS